MGKIGLALAVALLFATPAHAENTGSWQVYISQASARFGVPEDWIVRVMRAESSGQTILGGRPIRSPKGAMGLMQLMPATWNDMRISLSLGANPDDPRDNIIAGTAYLRLMFDRFGYPGCIAAYNTGPGNYTAYLAGRRSLPRETIAYVASIAGTARIAHSGTNMASDTPIVPPINPRMAGLFYAVSHVDSGAIALEARAITTESSIPISRTSALFAVRNDPSGNAR